MSLLRQLPRWTWFGTGVLAFIAGLVTETEVRAVAAITDARRKLLGELVQE